MKSYCPNCVTESVHGFICSKCKTDFHTGPLLPGARRKSKSLVLPSVEEALPNRIAVMLRAKNKKRKCRIRIKE
jgi:hypothetical protein